MMNQNRQQPPNNPRGRGNLLRHNTTHVQRNKSTVKKDLKDFNYYLGTSRQATEYEITTEFIKNHIKKEFDYGNDIATALDNLQEFRIINLKPILLISDDEDESIRLQENKQFEFEFKEEFSAYMKRRQIYENNRIKA